MKREILAGFLFFGAAVLTAGGCGKGEADAIKKPKAQTSSRADNSAQTVKKGDKVAVHYTGAFTDGKKFDSSYDRGKPIEFTVGAGQMIKGFDEAVVGMKVGQEKKITLKPSEAYGERDEKLKTKLPKKIFPKDYKFEKGKTVPLQAKDGRRMTGTIIGSTKDSVEIDLNNPMAGKTLVFDIKLVEIK